MNIAWALNTFANRVLKKIIMLGIRSGVWARPTTVEGVMDNLWCLVIWVSDGNICLMTAAM